MTLLWIIPAGLAAVGTAVVIGLARRAAEEIAGVRSAFIRLRGVGEAAIRRE